MTQASSLSSPTVSDQPNSPSDALRRSRRKRSRPTTRRSDSDADNTRPPPKRTKAKRPQKKRIPTPVPAGNQSMMDTAETQEAGGDAVVPESEPKKETKIDDEKPEGTSVYRRNYMRQYRLMQREKIQSLPEEDRQCKLEQIRAGVRERVRRFRLRKALGVHAT